MIYYISSNILALARETYMLKSIFELMPLLVQSNHCTYYSMILIKNYVDFDSRDYCSFLTWELFFVLLLIHEHVTQHECLFHISTSMIQILKSTHAFYNKKRLLTKLEHIIFLLLICL